MPVVDAVASGLVELDAVGRIGGQGGRGSAVQKSGDRVGVGRVAEVAEPREQAEGQMKALGRSQLGRAAIQASISLSSPVFRPSGRKLAVTELRANWAITSSLKPNVARRAS